MNNSYHTPKLPQIDPKKSHFDPNNSQFSINPSPNLLKVNELMMSQLNSFQKKYSYSPVTHEKNMKIKKSQPNKMMSKKRMSG